MSQSPAYGLAAKFLMIHGDKSLCDFSASFKLSNIRGAASENKSSNACLISAIVYEFSSFDNCKPKASSPIISLSTFDLPNFGARLSKAVRIDFAEYLLFASYESLLLAKNMQSLLVYVTLL